MTNRTSDKLVEVVKF